MDAREYLVQGAVHLKRGSVMRLARGRGLIVYVWRGEVWITQERDFEDHFVGAGGWFRITGTGLTLISALQASALSLTASRPESYAGQIVLTH